MMKTDEQIMEELKRLTEGLLFMSESDYPFEVVHWAGATEITPQYLQGLVADQPESPVQTLSLDDFFRAATREREEASPADQETTGRYRALVEALKNQLDDLRVYKIGRVNLPVYIVGRSPSRDWIGLSTRVVET